NFPDPMLREFGGQAIEFPSRRRTSIVVLRLNSRNFPVYSRKTGKRRNRDEFANDCPHRQFLASASCVRGALQTRCKPFYPARTIEVRFGSRSGHQVQQAECP